MREVRSWTLIACALLLAGCRQHGEKAGAEQSDPQEGEITVALGDCAPVTTPFVSGPEPQLFEVGSLAAPKSSLYMAMADGGDVSASLLEGDVVPPPEPVAVPAPRPSGYGISGGGSHLRDRTNEPQILIGDATTKQTGIEATTLRRYIKRNVQSLFYCYEKQLLDNAKLAGIVKLQLAITDAGVVSAAQASGVSPQVEQCIAETAAAIQFPEPADHQPLLVGIGIALAPTSRRELSPPPLVDPPATAELAYHPRRARPRGDANAFASAAGGSAALSNAYLPGTASPLQNLRIALRDCFRRQDKRYAAVVFDLGPRSLVAHGLAAPAFDRCIAELASQVNVTERSRCSVVFGAATAGTMPGVDITADAITMNGKTLARPVAVMAGDAKPWWKIEAIFDAATDRVRTTLASTEPLTLEGPLVIRPLPTTPMKVVTKLVYTLIAAGEDPILAAQRTGTWELLRDRALPVVPVPVGTGASWTSDRDRVRGAHAADDKDRVYVSLLVTNKDVWVRASGSDGAWVADANLAGELSRQKAALSDRTDIEIAATGEVPYSRLVDVIDRARAAGFTDWSLMAKRNLSAPPGETKVNAR